MRRETDLFLALRSIMTETPMSSDLEIAQKALRDHKSEEILLRRVYPRIVQIVRQVTRNQSHVDDIAQMAAIEVTKSLKTYRGEGSLEAWAGRIAYRTAMRNLKRKNLQIAPIPIGENDNPRHDTPEKCTSRRQLFDLLLSKLNAIPEKRRTPLLLHLAYGYTVKEVSQLTEASQNTVKDRLKTGFKEFQSIMDQHPGLMAKILEELQ